MKKKFKRKIFLIIALVLSCLTMSGCGEKLKDYVSTSLPTEMRERITANLSIAQQLRDAGFLSPATYDNIEATLKKAEAKYEKEFDNLITNGTLSGCTFTKAIRDISTVDGAEIHAIGDGAVVVGNNSEDLRVCELEESDPCSDNEHEHHLEEDSDTLKDRMITNFMIFVLKNISCDGDAKKIYTKKTCEPIELLDDKIADEVNSKFDYQVYVLDSDFLSKQGDNSLDGVMEIVQASIKTNANGKLVINAKNLNNYFTPALDEDGEPVRLIEVEKEQTGKTLLGKPIYTYKMPEEFQVVQVSKDQSMEDTPGLSGYKNIVGPSKPGYDMIACQDGVPCLSIKLKEFNKDAVDNLNKLIGINEGKYIFYTDGDTKRVYLMEYPVSYLKELKPDSSDSNKVRGKIEKSGLGINIYTGKIIKYDSDGKGGWLPSGTPVNETVDKYLTTDSASSGDIESKSSFIVKGTTKTTISHSMVNSGKERDIACGRIILRDYLEGTFAPGFIEDENVVVFGRKIRLSFNDWEESQEEISLNGKKTKVKQFTPIWHKGTDMAYFVDKEGIKIETSPELQITDFAAINSLMMDKYSSCQVKSLVCKGETTLSTKYKGESGSLPTIDQIAHLTVKDTGIVTTTYFPSEKIGKDDFDTDTDMKQRFYVIATNKNMFESSLFSDWINSKSSTASLQWWNQYLHDNGFVYTADQQAVNEYLKSNYAYELSQNGIIVLDLQTVADIQEMYDKEDDVERGKQIRTFFMILGWIIIIYAMILLLCWGLDANADIGVKLLEKLTFGHWVAVKYESDIPYNNANGSTYLTGGKMFIKFIILVIVGLILIYVNILNVVLRIIQLFAPVARVLEKLIQGLK